MQRIGITILTLTLIAAPAFAQDQPAPAPPRAIDSDTGKVTKPPEEKQPDPAKQAADLYESARKLFFQAKYKDAIKPLTDAIKLDPTKSGYKLLLAKAYRLTDQSDKAADILAEILKENPEHVEAGVTLAELLSPVKQPDKVIATLEPLLKFKRDYPLYHMLGQAYYEKENLAKARQYLEEAVRLNPRAGGDYYQLGNIYLMQSRFAKADDVYKTAGGKLDKKEDADAYEKAGDLDVSDDVFHFKLASVYFNLRNYLGQITTAKVIGGKPGDIKDHMLLIDPVPGAEDTFYIAGPRSAIFQAAKAQAMGIKVPGIKFLEANIWQSARRFAKADGLYKELEGKLDKADEGLFWYYWANTALGLDQLETYLQRLDKAIAAQPEVYKPTLADAYVTVALRYQQRGDTKKHLEHLAKAVQTNPLSASLHLTLGDAHWQLGHQAKAVEQYKLVLELEPDHALRARLLNRIRGEEDIPMPPKDTGPTRTAENK